MSDSTHIENTFGDRLSYLLKREGITPYRVFSDTKITQTTIANYLGNKTKPDTNKLEVLADYFRVSSRWLKTGEGEMQSNIAAEPQDEYLNTSAEDKEVFDILNRLKENINVNADEVDKVMTQYKLLLSSYQKAKKLLIEAVKDI